MLRRAVALVSVLGCLALAPLAAQEHQSSAPVPARQERTAAGGGPRLAPEYPRYEPAVAQQNSLATTAAAADRVAITITTLGLVLLIVLLVLLIA